MNSIVTLIENIVAELNPEASFLHGTKGWQNIQGDDVGSPVVFLDEPIFSNDTFHQGGLVDSEYPLRMMFLTNSQHEDTPDKSREHIDAMRRLRRQFVLRLKEAKDPTTGEHIFKDVSGVQTTDAINIPEVNRYLTGCIVTLNATPLNSDSVCVS